MGKSVNEIIKKVIILPTCTPSFAQVPNALSFIFPPPFFFGWISVVNMAEFLFGLGFFFGNMIVVAWTGLWYCLG